MAETQQPLVSIRPSDFSHGGGLLDDADVNIKAARWVIWDYQGKSEKSLAAHLCYVDDDGKEHDQYYSAGKPDSFVPSRDEKTLVRVGKRDSLSDSSNFFQFISSIVNAGYPEDKIEGSDLSFLDGMRVHVKQEAQQERKGLANQPGEGDRKRTVLCVSKILLMPGETEAKGKGKRGAASASAGKANGAAAASAGAGAIEDDTVAAVLDAVSAAGGSLPKAKLSQTLFAALKAKPMTERSAIVTLAFKDEFLGAEGRPWAFDGKEISLG